jgi:hypothetical protein
MIRKFIVLALVVSLILAGCNLPSATTPTATMDANAVITAAAATAFAQLSEVAGKSTSTPSPTITDTPPPPTDIPTPTVEVKLEPFDAVCTANVQVKSWPGRGGETLGGIFYERGIKVLARNDNGQWWYIVFADSPTGFGWVLSSAFQLKGDVALLPIALERPDGLVFVPPVTWPVVGTPLPLPTLSKDNAPRPATVTTLSKVRTCPTTSCQIIGYLQVGDQISMTGRWESGKAKWAQFLFPSGPNGKGWVDRENIQPGEEAFGGLPYFDLLGREITPEPPTPTLDPNISPTPSKTPTSTPPGPKAEIIIDTVVYTSQSSLSPVLGTLGPKTKIFITAQSLNRLYFQIQYPPDTTGRGYITTSDKQVKLLGDFRYLPFIDANGTPLP